MFFFFNDTATTEIYTVMNTLSLHDALPLAAPFVSRWTGTPPCCGKCRSHHERSTRTQRQDATRTQRAVERRIYQDASVSAGTLFRSESPADRWPLLAQLRRNRA